MKKEIRSNDWLIYTALTSSGVAIVISIIAICFSCPRNSGLGFDYQGILVGVLSLLVTVLIGWNIYTFIDIKEESQRINKFRTEIENKIKQSSFDMQLDLKLEMMRVVPVIIAQQTGDLTDSLKFMFNTFHENANNNSLAKTMAREYILQTIIGLKNSDNKTLINHLVGDLKDSIKMEEIESFLHDFLKHSDEDKTRRYAGIQNVLLELLKAQS